MFKDKSLFIRSGCMAKTWIKMRRFITEDNEYIVLDGFSQSRFL